MTTKQIQDILDYLGYTTSNDGARGPATAAAVKAFQGDKGLTVDGDPGPKTQAALLEAVKTGWFRPVPKSDTGENAQPNSPATPDSSGGWDSLKYISREEFRCTCKGRYCNGFPVEPSLATARIDEAIRAHFGRPLTITSGIRCKKRNAEVGGVSGSQHTLGIASDIQVQGVSPAQVAAYAETLMPNTGGIGIYSWGVHIDTRAAKARWKG